MRCNFKKQLCLESIMTVKFKNSSTHTELLKIKYTKERYINSFNPCLQAYVKFHKNISQKFFKKYLRQQFTT